MTKELCNDEDHDFVEFGYSPIGFSYCCSKCTKGKLVDHDNPTEIEERDLPINFVPQRDSWDCSIAVLAMALGSSYEEALKNCRGYLNPNGITVERTDGMHTFLYDRNSGTVRLVWAEDQIPTTYELNKYWSKDTILIVGIMPFASGDEVNKDNGEETIGHVCLFYDGLVYCPKLGVVDAEQYFHRLNYGIYSIISFPK